MAKTQDNLASFDETARLILMEQQNLNIAIFMGKMLMVHDELASKGNNTYELVWNLYAKYHGVDGRPPTHSIETGKLL